MTSVTHFCYIGTFSAAYLQGFQQLSWWMMGRGFLDSLVIYPEGRGCCWSEFRYWKGFSLAHHLYMSGRPRAVFSPLLSSWEWKHHCREPCRQLDKMLYLLLIQRIFGFVNAYYVYIVLNRHLEICVNTASTIQIISTAPSYPLQYPPPLQPYCGLRQSCGSMIGN